MLPSLAVQINWLVSIWEQHWHLIGQSIVLFENQEFTLKNSVLRTQKVCSCSKKFEIGRYECSMRHSCSMLPHLTLSVFVAEGNVNFTLQTNSLVTALCLPGDFDKCLLTLINNPNQWWPRWISWWWQGIIQNHRAVSGRTKKGTSFGKWQLLIEGTPLKTIFSISRSK